MKVEGRDIFISLLAVACLASSSTSSRSTLKKDGLYNFTTRLSLNDDSNEANAETINASVVNASSVEVEAKVLRLVNLSNFRDSNELISCTGSGGVLVETLNGNLYEFSSCEGEGLVIPCESVPALMEPCPWIGGLLRPGSNELLVFGLSERHRLYCGERLLCSASSSFVVSPSHGFLAYVTLGSRSEVRFLPLNVLASYDPLMGSDHNIDILEEGYEPRSVERGSKLVSVLPHTPTVILQLPRGNLEAVYPRALVLPYLMTLIGDGDYHLALDMMRRQRVDTNLLVDMDVTYFLEYGIDRLVWQVKNIDHLNLFIACLQNNDITEFKYVIPYWFQKSSSNGQESAAAEFDNEKKATFDFSTKVNQVCSKMRESMIKAQREDNVKNGHFLCPILSTFAKENPPQLEKALALIKTNAESNDLTGKSGKKTLLSEKAQSSIQYLAFLADYKLLFDTALGMYDFSMAKAVARNSQMDPKVYLPMLKKFSTLPEFIAKYEVDLKLNRFESALSNLFKSGLKETDAYCDEDHFEKCLLFIEEHKLHRLGLELFHNNSVWYRRILISLGEHLLRENKSDAALSIFQATNPRFTDGAKRAARASGNWRTYFALLLEDCDSKVTNSDVQKVAVEIAEEVASGKGGMNSRREGFLAGSRILIDYSNDISGAIDMLISAEMWFEGRRLATLHDQHNHELLSRIIDATSTYGYNCLEDFESRAEKFDEANKRYTIVLDLRKQAKREGADDGSNHDETGSLFSIASTATNASIRSNISSSTIGSVSSVSSVISAGALSSFTIVGDDAMKHKSKFNQIGRKKKKKRKTRKERRSVKPGSEEELKSLICTLKQNVIDDEYCSIIVQTIQFLSEVDKISIAKEIYCAYEAFRMRVEKCQNSRIELTREKSEEQDRDARRGGQFFENIPLECEKEVDSLRCSDLPTVVHDFFSYVAKFN